MSAQRYECKLSSELLEKAVTELNEPEDNEARLAAIDQLRERFQAEQNEYELLRTDDAFILRFLRAKKFNQDKAFATLVNYHQKRRDIREVYDKVDNPESLSALLDHAPMVPLKVKASDASTIIVNRPGIGPPELSLVFDHMAIGILTLERLLDDESTQINGITSINDYTYAGFNLIKQCTPHAIKRMSGMVQDAMPIRLKTAHLVNEYKIFSLLFALFKPFVKEKIQKRMQFHGTNFTNLHAQIEAKNLPSFLAGTGPDLDAVGWKKELLSTTGQGEETTL